MVERKEPDMRLLTGGSIFVLAAGITVGATSGLASAGGCSTTCSSGGAGQGGVSSDGNAHGFRLEGPSTRFPGATFTNQGNENAGHISLSGAADGMASGAYTPQGVVVGHYTGDVADGFGTSDPCSGICG